MVFHDKPSTTPISEIVKQLREAEQDLQKAQSVVEHLAEIATSDTIELQAGQRQQD